MARIVPSGGLFLWANDQPEGVDTMEMFNFVFQKNIARVPGKFFCTDGSRKNSIWLNFSAVSEEKITRYISILGDWINRHLEK